MKRKDPEQTKQIILRGLKATVEETVYIDITDIMLILGVEETTELVQTMVETHERKAQAGRKIPKSHYTGYAAFNRASLLEKIEENDKDQAKESGIQLQDELLSSFSRIPREV